MKYRQLLKLVLASCMIAGCAPKEEIVDNNQTPEIEQPEVIQLEQLIVTYDDGNELLITQPEFLTRFANAIANQYEEVKSESDIWETYCTIEMNEDIIEIMTPHEIKINGKDYRYHGKEHSILWDIIYAHAFECKEDNPAYLKTTQVATIEELLSGIIREHEENVIRITDVGTGGMFSSLKPMYNFKSDLYIYPFYNVEKMEMDQFEYQWYEQKATHDSCEYDRLNQTFNQCSDVEQAWILKGMEAFLVNVGNEYISEEDFLAQESDFVFKSNR